MNTCLDPYKLSSQRAELTQKTCQHKLPDLRERLFRIDSQIDSDADGLTGCEEDALFFPRPNFPVVAGPTPTGVADLPVFFSKTLPNNAQSDGDGTKDGSEVTRQIYDARSAPLKTARFIAAAAAKVRTPAKMTIAPMA